MEDKNNNKKMVVETHSEGNKSGINKRRKKKRAADAGVRKFEGSY